MFIYLTNFNKKDLLFNKPGQYVVFFQNISGEINFQIESSNVNLYVFGLYTGDKNSYYSLKTNQNHRFKQSTSHLLVKSVMDDKSTFLYDGLIRIEEQAIKTHAYQKNINLLLSENAEVVSEPHLEILTDDVYCTHGSTTGRLDTNAMQYLQARGLSVKSAKKLVVNGFINDVYKQLERLEPNQKVKKLSYLIKD